MMLVLVVFLKFFILGQATFFGGENCCCDCGQPMPPSCGCSIPICPPPIPCPPPICPTCKACPPAPSCPPAPVPICPPPQPVYLPSSNCGCGGGNAPTGGYISPRGPNFAPPPSGGSYASGYQPRSAGFPTSFNPSPPSLHPNHLLGPEVNNIPIPPPVVQQPFPAQNEVKKTYDPTFSDHRITNQLTPLSSTTAPLTERRTHESVIISENKCNSIVLRDLLLKNMDQTDPVISKRAVHNAAQEIMREDEVDIICSDAGFTYIHFNYVYLMEDITENKQRIQTFSSNRNYNWKIIKTRKKDE
ncbi:Protein transport protein [Dirofilaria immitis]